MSFWNSKEQELNEELNTEVIGLRKSIREAKDELADVKHQKKMEDEDIKHMVKMSKEKNELELQKKLMEYEGDKDKAIAAVKDEYRDKMEGRLQLEVDNMKEMYGQILARLPDVTARLKGDI